jgi:hypothetical protein
MGKMKIRFPRSKVATGERPAENIRSSADEILNCLRFIGIVNDPIGPISRNPRETHTSSLELESMSFESESRLTRIEDLCFSNCSLKSICIPENLEFIDPSIHLYSLIAIV